SIAPPGAARAAALGGPCAAARPVPRWAGATAALRRAWGGAAARETTAAALVLLLTLACYLRTLAPTITWRHGGGDGGDLAAAVAAFGIAHPPGYPAYVLLGHLVAALPLGGDLAYRLNLLSAAGAALAAAL